MRTLLVVTWIALVGCSGGDSRSTAPPSSSDAGSSQPTDPARKIREADVIQLHDGSLYALSRSGSISIIDILQPGKLTMLGHAQLPGEPFEMYRRARFLYVMINRAVTADGVDCPPDGPRSDDPNAGAMILVLDVRDPAHIVERERVRVPGEIADSRMIGQVLYVASAENAACFNCDERTRTLLTSFDVSRAQLAVVDQLSFTSSTPQYDYQWGQYWKRSIVANDQRLYLSGHSDLAPGEQGDEGLIDVVDITDPAGALRRGARLKVPGALLSGWQLDERDRVLRVVSQRGAGRTGAGIDEPIVQTFRIDDANTFVPLGSMAIRLPQQEGLRAVRFDGERAYAITYRRSDPLFVIDLSDPAKPRQRGELVMPGFIYHIIPQGDRLLGLGVDRRESTGSLNVSLFDVADLDAPRLLSRAAFGTPYLGEDGAILGSELPEDQQRIGKAFRLLPGGLVVIPFDALEYGDSCENVGGGVQLVQWSKDTLVRRALLPMPGHPNRAVVRNGELFALSESHVRSFSLADLDVAAQSAEVVIGTCTPESVTDPSPPHGDGWVDNSYEPKAACSAAGSSSWPVVIGFALLASIGRRRRRR